MPARLTLWSNLHGLTERFDLVIGKLERFDVPVAPPTGGRPLSLWDHMSQSWVRSRVRMFATLGRDTESPWPTYEQTEERHFYKFWKLAVLGREVGGYRTELRWPETDRIWRSFCEPSNRYHVNAQTRTTLELGSSLPYAAKHDLGIGNAPRHLGGHRIPRRPLTRFGRWLIHEWERDATTYASEIGASIGAQLTGAQARLLPFRRALA